jgi:hypothetical protein
MFDTQPLYFGILTTKTRHRRQDWPVQGRYASATQCERATLDVSTVALNQPTNNNNHKLAMTMALMFTFQVKFLDKNKLATYV